MLTTLLAIAPIFILIIMGHLLRRGGIPSIEFWNMNDRLVYWVLIPSLLFYKMSTMDVPSSMIGDYAIVILSGFAAAMSFGLMAGKLIGFEATILSSIFQGSGRHNSFLVLATAESLYGTQGLALAALGVSILIPVTNLTVIPTMAILLSGNKRRSLFKAVLHDLSRNPLILAVGVGLLANSLDFQNIPIIHDVTKILGGAALPIVLLCVGANIRIRKMATSFIPTLITFSAKMLIFPLVIFLVARSLGLSETATLVAMLFGAVSTAPSAFTLAREMGGDAPLMAAIITLQTLIAFITIPLTLYWAERLI